MTIKWDNAPKWAIDVRNAKGAYGLNLIFTNDDKRYCEVDDICDEDYEQGDKDYLGVILKSEIVSVRPS